MTRSLLLSPFCTVRAAARLQRGYTAVELVMAIGVFAVGITGVFAMQRVTSGSNSYAKNLAVASYVAESWQERLAVDALNWTQSAPITNTTWFAPLGAADDWGWDLPATSGDFGPSFSIVGAYNDHGSTPENTVFCTHIRLTRLISTPSSGMIRTEVRVFWPKPGEPPNLGGSHYCTDSADLDKITAEHFHFVHKASVVRQTGGMN